MKTLRTIGAIVLVMSLLNGCKKEDNNPITQTKHLQLDEVKRAYYNSNNMRYETNFFSADSARFTYNINVEEGKKYRVCQYGIYMENVELTLFSKDRNSTLLIGEQANVGFTAKFFVYTSDFTGNLQIITECSNSHIYGQPFYLSFEEIGTYQLSWKGYNWLCDGDWSVNSNGDLTVKNYRSGFSKWARLIDTSLTSYNADLQFNAPSGSIPHGFGLAVLASNTIFEMINLPEESRQFFIYGTNNWEMWFINMGNGGGIGREVGNLNTALVDGSNTFSVNVSDSNVICHVNNEQAISINNNLTETDSFYITNEDLGTDSITITDIRFY